MMSATLPSTANVRNQQPATGNTSGPAAKKEPLNTLQLLGLVGEIGYLIAIPAALLGFGGAYLDKTLSTSPLFVVIGLAIALASSTLAIWHRIKPLLNS